MRARLRDPMTIRPLIESGMSGKPSLLSSFDHGSILFLFAATIGFLSHRYFHYRQLVGALLVSLAIIAVGGLFALFDITDPALLVRFRRPKPTCLGAVAA